MTAAEPPFKSYEEAIDAWIEHDRTHGLDPNPCKRCIELDAIMTQLREAEGG